MALQVEGCGVIGACASQQAFVAGDEVVVFVRPERITLTIERNEGLRAVLVSKTYMGRCIECGVQLENGTNWIVNSMDDAQIERMQVGASISIAVAPRDVLVYLRQTEGTR
jgi:ABC-type Fe3+/spermidine/putrescine transport system ATPase subunit